MRGSFESKVEVIYSVEHMTGLDYCVGLRHIAVTTSPCERQISVQAKLGSTQCRVWYICLGLISFRGCLCQMQASLLQPLKLIVSNAGAALGQHRRYEQPSPLVQLPSVPLPTSARNPELGAAPLREPNISERRFSGGMGDDEITVSRGSVSSSTWTSNPACPHGQPSASGAAASNPAECGAVQTLKSQAEGVESMYRAVLARMEALAPILTADLAALAVKKKAVADLQALIL